MKSRNIRFRQLGLLGTAGITWDENFNLVLASLTALALKLAGLLMLLFYLIIIKYQDYQT